MELHQQQNHAHNIQTYDDHSVTIQNERYSKPILITAQHILAWNIQAECSPETLFSIFLEDTISCPEIIIIGSAEPISMQIRAPIQAFLSKKRIGVEFMSIGAACRTFNILLSEDRPIALGLWF